MDSSDLQLQELGVEEALDRWLSELEFLKAVSRMESQELAVTETVDRVTAGPVVARMSSPHYYSAAVDGLAVRAADTFVARTGQSVEIDLASGQGLFVETGSPLPEGTDAVVPVREIDWASAERVRLSRACNPWRNVRPTGEDVAEKEVILPRDHRIGPLDIGAMVAAGVEKIRVYKQPRVSILVLGSHLVSAGTRPAVGQMIDTNGPALVGLVTGAGAQSNLMEIVPERLEEAAAALHEAAQGGDLVLVVAGPSHGTPFLAKLFSDLGERVAHGVAAKPCSAIALGVIDSTPVIGLPFHPVSVYLGFELFGRPALGELLGPSAALSAHVAAQAELAVSVHSPFGTEEFVRVKTGLVDDRLVAVPEQGGASTLMSLVRSSGFVRIPADVEEWPAGYKVSVSLLSRERSSRGNILLLGTHDICYDLLRSHLLTSFPDVQLHTSATGGSAGLRALREGRCHIAAIHLFDEDTGEYNVPFLKREMPDTSMVLINLFSRDLGLLVAPGNPLNIQGLPDLIGDVRFINRQVGSGTRALLDYHLRTQGVESSKIHGFEAAVRTHMAVAAAVSSGTVDAGPGISTAARSLRLDFVPCIPERLDLAIPRHLLNRFPIPGLLQVIRSHRFRREAAQSLPDYDFTQTGQVLWES